MIKLLEIEIPLKPPSLNDWYAGKHWGNRKDAKDLWLAEIKSICNRRKLKQITEYPVIVETQAYFKGKRAMDSSNLITANKLIEDALIKCKVLKGDSPEYVYKNIVNAPILGCEENKTILIIRKGEI